MEASIENIIPGRLLLAEPFMLDGNFKRSVVLVCDQSEKDGTVGFVLNKPIDMLVTDLIKDFPEFEASVFYGGPVATDTIHYIHDVGEILEESIHVKDNLYWGGNFEQLKALVKQGLILPRNIKFFVGYSGWSKGQLDDELQLGSWIIGEMDMNYVFGKGDKGLWKKVLNNKGDVYTVISQVPDTTSYN